MTTIRALRVYFIVVLAAMLAVTGWASLQVPLWETPRAVVTHPWFIATLFDAYFGFLAFYLWILWRERSWARGIAWLVALLLLGNIAMAVYALIVLFQLPANAPAARLFEPRHARP
jgi:hypothetical protein